MARLSNGAVTVDFSVLFDENGGDKDGDTLQRCSISLSAVCCTRVLVVCQATESYGGWARKMVEGIRKMSIHSYIFYTFRIDTTAG